ncbi:MAG TPA: mobilization protein [Steroidobacteraceae bacterium]
MANAKLDEQISTLEERLKALKLRQSYRVEREKAIDRKRARKADTRRKNLIGAVFMEKIAQGALQESQLQEWLNRALTRKDDRALFVLEPSSASRPSQER